MVRRRSTARKKRPKYAGRATRGASPSRRHGVWVVLVLGALVVVNLYVFVWDKNTSVAAIRDRAEHAPIVAGEPLAAARLPSAHAGSAAAPPAAPTPPTAIDGKVGKGDTLGRLLKRAGLGAGDTDEVIRALAGVTDFKAIKAGQAFHLARTSAGRVERFELELAKDHRVVAERKPGGGLVGRSSTE